MRTFDEIAMEYQRMLDLDCSGDEEAMVIRLATITALEWVAKIGMVQPSMALRRTIQEMKEETHGEGTSTGSN